MLFRSTVLGAGIAVLVSLVRRPDALSLVIETDLRLRLKQRVSTAFEYSTRRPGDPMTGPLLEQAHRVRLPPRVQHLYPFTWTLWAKWLPLAVAALLFAFVVEVRVIGSGASAPPIDALVVDEGVRLRAFARDMARRAARDSLPVSATQAERMRQAGERMSSGQVDRREALERLAQLTTEVDAEIGRAHV